MKYTSAKANKLLDNLNTQLKELFKDESQRATYVAAVTEDPNDVAPEFSFIDSNFEINKVRNNILKVKHAINKFNINTTLPCGYTIDEALILLPNLNLRKARLEEMKNKLPKSRVRNYGSTSVIEYEYVNYRISTVREEYEKINKLIQTIQTELDYANNTLEEIEIDLK